MDFEKLLRAYIRHVIESDGSSFLNEQNVRHSEGLDDLEPDEVARLNEVEREVVKLMNEDAYADDLSRPV